MTGDVAAIVYVVDDDASAREAVAAIVKSMGIEPRTFPSAETFLDSYEPGVPGCIVSDIRMSGMSGIELLELLRKSSCALPVILLTAFADVPLAVRAMQQGAFTLLEKPTRNHELWEAIHRALVADPTERCQPTPISLGLRLAGLTPDEQRVVELIFEGKPNKAIASELDISLRTVGARRHAIFEKFGVRSVAELVRAVLEINPADAIETDEAPS